MIAAIMFAMAAAGIWCYLALMSSILGLLF